MFAIIKTGGIQYGVSLGDVCKIDKIDAQVADVLTLKDVLMTTSDEGIVQVGSPFVSGAAVTVEILKHVRNKKIIVFKKKRRHNYRRKNGHRQWMTVVKVVEIVTSS